MKYVGIMRICLKHPFTLIWANYFASVYLLTCSFPFSQWVWRNFAKTVRSKLELEVQLQILNCIYFMTFMLSYQEKFYIKINTKEKINKIIHFNETNNCKIKTF